MPQRPTFLINDGIYHIYSRSIAKFVIFNSDEEYNRFLDLLDLMRFTDFNYRYSRYSELDLSTQNSIYESLQENSSSHVDIIAYCIMPTHFHLILKQLSDDGIAQYIAKVCNSYAKYFNNKYHRQGPLWSTRFKSIEVNKDEQLLHLSRYIHLNPYSAGITKDINDWDYSSLKTYLNQKESNLPVDFDGLYDFTPDQYKKFVNDRADYQKSLSIIKNVLIDNYSG